MLGPLFVFVTMVTSDRRSLLGSVGTVTIAGCGQRGRQTAPSAVGRTSTQRPTWGNAEGRLSPKTHSYTYLVTKQGDETVAFDGNTGEVAHRDKSAVSVISATIGDGGNSILITDGTYDITDSITLAPNTHLQGTSWNSILRVPEGVYPNIINTPRDGISGVVVENMHLLGNTTQQVHEPGETPGGWGLVLWNVEGARIHNCLIEETEIHGMTIKQSSNVTITGNLLRNTAADGIQLVESQAVTMANNICDDHGHAGFIAIGSENVRIVTNHAERGGGNGIFLHGSQNCVVANNTVEDNGWNFNQHGIRLSSGIHHGSPDTPASQNIVCANRSKKNENWGIAALGDVPYNLITQNVTSGNGSGAITSDADNSMLTTNLLLEEQRDTDPAEATKPVAYQLHEGSLMVDGTSDTGFEANSIALGQGNRFTVSDSDPFDNDGQISFTWDSVGIGMSAAIGDDTHTNQYPGSKNWNGDAIQLGIAGDVPSAASGFQEFVVSLSRPDDGTPTESVIHREIPDGSADSITESVDVSVTRNEDTDQTVYELVLPWDSEWMPIDASTDLFGLAFTVNDVDGEGNFSWTEWADVDSGGEAIIRNKSGQNFAKVALKR